MLVIQILGRATLAQEKSPNSMPAGPSADVAQRFETTAPPTDSTDVRTRPSLFWLLKQGGGVMILIALASVVALGLIVERTIGLRTSRILPCEFLDGLSSLTVGGRFLDPREVYQLCQRYPSTASQVIRSMLVKVGRPHSELLESIQVAGQRAADRLHVNVRWLNMITAVAPLVGLLGTVWGMILAFYGITLLDPGQNKADFLASGIYTALVTTLGGLCVAIPTAVCSHLFEGRIIRLLHRIQELAEELLPQFERFEGRLRVTRDGSTGVAVSDNGDTASAPTGQPSNR
jgi:biopolymer transport protein ExbB